VKTFFAVLSESKVVGFILRDSIINTKIGRPKINPHGPRVCSDTSKIRRVINIGNFVKFADILGNRIYASRI